MDRCKKLYRRQGEATDDEIDAGVYELYALTVVGAGLRPAPTKEALRLKHLRCGTERRTPRGFNGLSGPTGGSTEA